MLNFKNFKKLRTLEEETELVKVYKYSQDGTDFKVIITKSVANKHTNIHCTDNYISWEQVPLFPKTAGKSFGDRMPIYKFDDNKKCAVIFAIKGSPNGITGLDDGIFRCADNFDKNCVNVMTYNRFKKL